MDQKDLNGNTVPDPKPKLVEEHVRGHPDWVYPDDWLEDHKDLTDEEIDFFDEEVWNDHMTPFTKCVACEEHIIDIVRQYNKYALLDGMYSNKKDGFVCFPCRENDETYRNTVIIYKPDECTAVKYLVGDYFDDELTTDGDLTVDDIEDLKARDFDYNSNDEESPIQFRYVPTDGWRGYHEPVVPEGWIELHGDSILAWSEDEEHLKEFDTDIKHFLWEMGVEFAMGIGTTSNLFSSTYTVIAKIPQDELDGMLSMMKMVTKVLQLKEKHRDRARFMRTVLTGSSEKTEHADKMVQAYDMLEEGKTVEEIVKELI